MAARSSGAATGIGNLIGNGPPPRLAFIAQGLPDAIALGLAAGLLIGWIPAWISLPPRKAVQESPPAPYRGNRPPASAVTGVTAALAGVVLIVSTGIVVADARQAGLAGALPPSVQQPQADPVPTGTPPPPVAPAGEAAASVAQNSSENISARTIIEPSLC